MDNVVVNFFIDPVSYNLATFLFRLTIGLALLTYGIKKICNRKTLGQHFPTVMGFSSETSFHLAMVIETTASLCMIFGLFTRLVCLPAIVNMGIATSVSKDKYFTSPALPYFFGFITIFITGPGAWSLDFLLF